FTAGSSAATYTATIQAQYRLTVAASPTAGGTVTANPSSPDGFYSAGTSVTISATPATGYYFLNFNGDVTGYSSPQTVSMSVARNGTANFTCKHQFSFYPPSTAGSGPTNGFVQWQAGDSCTWSAASD